MASNETAIQLTGVELAHTTASGEARNRRDVLLLTARRGKTIDSAESAQRAGALLTEMKEFTRSIESARKEAKAPIIEIGKKIDGLAAELTADLETEAERIDRVLGTYQQEQKRKAEDAARKKWDEEQAIIRKANEDAAAAKKKLEEEQAEIKRKADAAQKELDDKAARVRSESGRQKAEEAQRKLDEETARKLRESEDKARAEADAHRDRVENQIIEKRVEVSAAAFVPSAGIATGDKLEFEVTDIHALYEANPALVKMEPQKAAITNHLKSLRDGLTLPGVRHWWTSRAIVR